MRLVPKKFQLILLLIVLASIGVFTASKAKLVPSTPEEISYKNFDFTKGREFFKNQINLLGGDAAYQDLKAKLLADYPRDAHYIVHLFGEVLYENTGVPAITVCDNNFAFGCYHGVIVTSLKDKGLDIIPGLNQGCVQKNGSQETGCRHGIGHGLLEYLGHNKLQQALEICSSLQKVSPLGCTQGVFMEYNMPGMVKDGSFSLVLRELRNKDQLHQPCESLAEKFQISCYYEQSQWWVGVLDSDFSKVGTLCQDLKNDNTRRSCYLGVGVHTSQRLNFDINQTISACSQMPTLRGQLDCRSGAGWVFKVNPSHRSKAHELCSGLAEPDQNICLRNSIQPDQLI